MEEPQSFRAPSIAAEVELSANASGLSKVMSEASTSLMLLAGPIVEIAQGGNVASAAWRGLSDIFKYQVLGTVSVVRDVVQSLGMVFRNSALDAENLTKGVQKVARMQVLEGQFTPLLKSADAAKNKIAELQKLADKSPFRLEQVAEGARALELLTKGSYAGADAVQTLMNVSSLTGAPIGELGATIGQLHDGLASGREVGIYARRLQELGAISGTTRNQLEALSASGADNQTTLAQGFGAVLRDFKKADGQSELLSKKLQGAESTRADKLSSMQAAYAEPFAEVETARAQREAKEYEAKRPMMQRRGEIDSAMPSLAETIKGKISENTIQTDVGKQVMSVLSTAWKVVELGVKAWFYGEIIAYVAGLVASSRRLKSFAGVSGGEMVADLGKSIQAKASSARSNVTVALTKATSGIVSFRQAEQTLTSMAPEDAAPRAALLNKLGFENSAAGNRQAVAHIQNLASQERVANVRPELRDDIYKDLGVKREPGRGVKYADLTATQIASAPVKVQDKLFQSMGIPVAGAGFRTTSDYQKISDGINGINEQTNAGKKVSSREMKLRSGVYEMLGVQRLPEIGGQYNNLSVLQLKSAPTDVQNKIFSRFGLPDIKPGATRPDAHYQEVVNGVNQLNAASKGGAVGVGLLGKAVNGVGSAVKALGGMLGGILGRILIFAAVGVVLEMTWGKWKKYSQAKDEAIKSGAATSDLINKLEDEAAAAQSAEDRANSYRKSLEALADAKTKLRDVKLHKDDMTGPEYRVRLASAQDNVKQHENSVLGQKLLEGAGGMNIEQQKAFVASVQRERELKNAHEQAHINSLSGEDAVTSAKLFADKKTNRRLELEQAKYNKDNFYTNKDFVEAQMAVTNQKDRVLSDEQTFDKLEAREHIGLRPLTERENARLTELRAERFGLSHDERGTLKDLRSEKENVKKLENAKLNLMKSSNVPAVVLAGEMEQNSNELSEVQSDLNKERKYGKNPEKIKQYEEKRQHLYKKQATLNERSIAFNAVNDVEGSRKEEAEARGLEIQTATRVARETFSKFQSRNQQAQDKELSGLEQAYRTTLEEKGDTPDQISEKVAGPEFVGQQAETEKKYAGNEVIEIAKSQQKLGAVKDARAAVMGAPTRDLFIKQAQERLSSDQYARFVATLKKSQEQAVTTGMSRTPGGTFTVEKNNASHLFEVLEAENSGAGTMGEMETAQGGLKTRLAGIEQKSRQGTQAAAQTILANRFGVREAQQENKLSAIEGGGSEREMRIASEQTKFKNQEAEKAEKLLGLARRGESANKKDIAQKELEDRDRPEGEKQHKDALLLLKAALYANVAALQQDAEQKRSQANEAVRKERDTAQSVLSDKTGVRQARHEEFLSSLKGYGTTREMAAAAETTRFTADEQKRAETLLATAEPGDDKIKAQITQKEAALNEAKTQNDSTGIKENTEALLLLKAALGANIGALQQDVLQKRAAANEAARREETLKRESNFSRSQAYLNSASTGYRFMEKNATGDSQRLEYRKKADALEDKAIFERTQKDEMESLPKMRVMRGAAPDLDPRAPGVVKNWGKEEGKIDPRFSKENLAKTKATLEVEKNKSEREIERSQRPVIASDLARVGGGKYETAGGSDVAKAQLDRLGDINAQLDQLNQLVKVLQAGVDSTNQ
jgi:hypothetical protein